MAIANQIPDLDCFARDFMKHQKSTSLKAAASDSGSNIVLVGDFNFPKPSIDW